MALAYIVVTYARVPEILRMVTGHGFRLGLILVVFAIFTIILSGGFFRILSSRITWALLGFTAWLCLGVPFSIWRGGSYGQFQFWLVSLISFLLVAGCVDGLEQCRKSMEAMAIAALFMELCSFLLGTDRSARDVGRLSFESGTLANANDLATLLLIGLPFCLLVVRTRTGFSVLRVAAFLGLALIPLTIVRTGSRGGLLALAILVLLYFLSIPLIQKIPMAVATVILMVAAIAFSSSSALDRYRTIFESSNAEYYSSAAEASAVQSTVSRKELFFRSVRMTFHHPLMGVGPGMFTVADANEAGEEGIPAYWHQTHNMYTQISSENGIPGLALYLAAIILCFRALRRTQMASRQYADLASLGNTAFCVQLSLIAFTITAAFASNAYYFFFPLLAGVSAALDRAVAAELERRAGPSQASKTAAPLQPQPVSPQRVRIAGQPGPRAGTPRMI